MTELLDELKDIPAEKALTAAAYFHAKFENIHPFADGNGRTGRLAMNYFLVCHDHPPVIIHEEDRKNTIPRWRRGMSRQTYTVEQFFKDADCKNLGKTASAGRKNEIEIENDEK